MVKAKWLAIVFVGVAFFPSFLMAQDPADSDIWNVESGDWGDDDNWIDSLGELSGTPTFDDDRWALIRGGVATIADDYQVGGLTIAGSGTVEINGGASLEVATEDDAFSVGQTRLDPRSTLRIQSDGSFKGLAGSIAGDIFLQQASSVEFTGDLSFNGLLDFEVTSTGNPTVKVGGEATIGGVVAPRFSGTDLTFGMKIPFIEADSVVLTEPKLQLPGVSLPRGIVADIIDDGGKASISVGNRPILVVDRASSEAQIVNANGGPISLTGYAIESELGLLNASRFDGFGGGDWDRPNPVNNVLAEFSLTNTQVLPVGDSLDIGNVYEVGETHPADEDLKFFYFTPDNNIVEGVVEYAGPANDLVLNANPETGEVTLQHLSSSVGPIEITGYRVVSASNSLVSDAWTSLNDGGDANWIEANPSEGFVSEFNPSDSKIFSNGTVYSLGNIFDVENGIQDLVLEYTTTSDFQFATVEYQVLGDTQPSFLESDFDQSGSVDFSDFLFLSTQFGQAVSPAGTPPDINSSGIVDFADFLVLSTQFGQSSAAAVVPEPNASTLSLFGGVIALFYRRKRVPLANDLREEKMQRTTRVIMTIATGLASILMLTTASDAFAVDDFTVSDFGNGVQIWWEAEDFDTRTPDNDDYFVLSEAPDGEEAFGDDTLNTINRNGGPGGIISYDFSIDQLGQAGTWYFWGRLINPNNQSDFMLVEGHPGDIIPTSEPFTGSFNNDQRVFESDTGPPFGWAGNEEAHIKQLKDGDNTMHIVHRSGDESVFWDVMMWTDDPDYRPTDDDYLDSEPFIAIDKPGDFNGDGVVSFSDYQSILDNFNTDVERGDDGDITFNGHVDYRDFVSFRKTLESEGAQGGQAVPEPSSSVLAWMAAIAVGCFRRRRSAQRSNTTLQIGRNRRPLVAIIAVALGSLLGSATVAQDIVVVQEEGTDYLAFEAEDFFELVNGSEDTGWGRVDVNDPFQSEAPVGAASKVLDTSTNAARQVAIFDYPGGNDQDYVRYSLEFAEEGDYTLYLRYSMFNLRGDEGYGNEDSFYFSSDFGFDGELEETDGDPRGPRDESPSAYATPPKDVTAQEGQFNWWNASANGSDEFADNPDAVYDPVVGETLDFGIAAREAGIGIDRVIFHTNPSLSNDELDAIISFDPFTIGKQPGDFNDDGNLDLGDFLIMAANFNESFEVEESFEKGDSNRDGLVDLRDFLQLRLLFNPPVAGAAAVPEPSAGHLGIAICIAATMLRRRRGFA